MRAGQKLSAVKALQSNEAGYGGAELKIGAVPAERGGLHDRHRRGVDPIDQRRTPADREEPQEQQRGQSDGGKAATYANDRMPAIKQMLGARV